MLQKLRSLFGPADAPVIAASSIPDGQRVYAVGDIHGRLDLFRQLVERIEADDAAHAPAETTIILLGDLVDRGPDSAGVIEEALALSARRRVRVLAGNHEEMFLESFTKLTALRHFLRFGGKETVLSYLPDPTIYDAMNFEEVQDALHRHVPEHHRAFLNRFEDMIRIGDYLFVHAGIRPDVEISAQKRSDLRWIREPFLDHPDDHGCIVVHGHTISEDVVERRNRIGIDTGAYMPGGRLTAVGLEGNRRWFLEAGGNGEIE